MTIQEDEAHYKFCLDVLKSFHLEPMQFFKRLTKKEEYEIIMFSWINTLYFRGCSVEETIEYIYKARYHIFFKNEVIELPKKKSDSIIFDRYSKLFTRPLRRNQIA